MFTFNRKSIDLNGTWKFNPDPYMRCKQQAWWKGEGADDAFFPCFNMEGLWEIQVPGTWKCEFEELTWYDGDVNYVKDFEVAEIPEDHEAFLCFDGVILCQRGDGTIVGEAFVNQCQSAFDLWIISS